MWSAISSFLLGGVGWFAAFLLGKPWLDFLNLRSQVHEEIIFTGNIGPMVKGTPAYDKRTKPKRRSPFTWPACIRPRLTCSAEPPALANAT